MIQETIETHVRAVLQRADIPIDDFSLELPKHVEHGDYATSICFKLASTFRKSPSQIGDQLTQLLASDTQLSEVLTATNINGFINFNVHPQFMMEALDKSVPKQLTPKKVLIEYVSANPTGPLHIGHGRWAVLGNCIERLLQYSGVQVDTENYINNAGNQIQLFKQSVNSVASGQPLPEDGYNGDYVQELAALNIDPVQEMIRQHKDTLESMGVSFTHWQLETDLHESGKVETVLEWLKLEGLSYEKEGAIWFKSSKFNDDKDRVLVKSDGALTYFAVDIAYHFEKLTRSYDGLINIWGADHHGYVNRMKAAVKSMQSVKNKAVDFTILIGQLVALYRNNEPVRMSKRTGEMITLDEVIDEIGADALRFFLVQKSADTHINFDLEIAKKQTAENPVFYIQYAHARLCRLLEKVGDIPMISVADMVPHFNELDRPLLMHLIQFDEEVFMAANQLAPHKIATYALTLAKYVHGFYERNPIVTAVSGVKETRIWIVKHIKQRLHQSLSLLGISAPEQM